MHINVNVPGCVCEARAVWCASGALVLESGPVVLGNCRYSQIAPCGFLIPAVSLYLPPAESNVGGLFLALLSAVLVVRR